MSIISDFCDVVTSSVTDIFTSVTVPSMLPQSGTGEFIARIAKLVNNFSNTHKFKTCVDDLSKLLKRFGLDRIAQAHSIITNKIINNADKIDILDAIRELAEGYGESALTFGKVFAFLFVPELSNSDIMNNFLTSLENFTLDLKAKK